MTEPPEPRQRRSAVWRCWSIVQAMTGMSPVSSPRLLRRKVSHVLETGASVVATGNPGCQLQIARGLRDSGSEARVVHPISLMAAAYRREAGAAA